MLLLTLFREAAKSMIHPLLHCVYFTIFCYISPPLYPKISLSRWDWQHQARLPKNLRMVVDHKSTVCRSTVSDTLYKSSTAGCKWVPQDQITRVPYQKGEKIATEKCNYFLFLKITSNFRQTIFPVTSIIWKELWVSILFCH